LSDHRLEPPRPPVDSRLGRRYWTLWSGATISAIGDGVRLAALPLLAASITSNPLAVAAVSLMNRLPWLIFALAGGVVADRCERARVMSRVDAVRCMVVALLALLVILGRISLPWVLVVAFALGVGETLYDNAAQALLPMIVRRERLRGANSHLFAGQVASLNFLGPPLGSAAFALSMWSPFAVDSLSFLAASGLTATLVPCSRIDSVAASGMGRAGLMSEMKEGMHHVWERPLLRSLVGAAMVVNLTQGASQSILVLFAIQELHIHSAGYGLLFTARGIGGVLGSLLASRVASVLGTAPALVASIGLTIPVFVTIALTSSAYLVAVMLAVNAFLGLVANVLMVSLRQAIVPNCLLGRVAGVHRLFSFGIGLPVGALLGGVLADTLGLRAPFIVSAAVIVLLVIVVSRVITPSTVADAEGDGDDAAPGRGLR
jgi:MFS family permease